MNMLFTETQRTTGRVDSGITTENSAFECIKLEISLRCFRKGGELSSSQMPIRLPGISGKQIG